MICGRTSDVNALIPLARFEGEWYNRSALAGESVPLEVLRKGARTLGLELSRAQIGQFRRYLAGLLEWNRRGGLTSPKALAEAERAHFLDSLTLVPLLKRRLPDVRRVVDVGTGGGFPGVPIKLAMPGLHLVLVEATQKKADFLRWLVAELGLADVEVLAQRVEEVAHQPPYREGFDAATARALGSLPAVLELTLPLCRIGGLVIAPRRGGVAVEVAGSAHALEALGGRLEAVEPVTVTVPGLQAGSELVVIEKVAPTPDRYPRRPGMPAKRSL